MEGFIKHKLPTERGQKWAVDGLCSIVRNILLLIIFTSELDFAFS